VLRYLLGSFALHTNIGRGIGAIADLNNGQSRFEPGISLLYFCNLILNLFAQGSINVNIMIIRAYFAIAVPSIFWATIALKDE